jgi:hypothetical protein
MSILLAMALAAAGPTKEEAKLLRPVKDSPTVQLDLNGAYILLRSATPASINLFRLATPPEVEDYRGRRWQALQKAHAKWVKKHAEWEQELKAFQLAATGGSAPEEPAEPTDANLDFQPIDQENLLGFGPLNRFAKEAGGSSTYLQRVWPGRYVLYGSIFINPKGGAAGTCVCMGTVAFDAKAGEITDVGSVMMSADPITFPRMLEKAKPEDVEGLRSGAITTMRLTPGNSAMPVDSRLTQYKVVPAAFRAAGPVPNYYGVQVDRLTAIPGILAYDRDKIVDATGAPAGH